MADIDAYIYDKEDVKDTNQPRGFLPPWADEQPYNSTATGYTNTLQVFSGQGRLFGINGYSSRASTQFILVIDSSGLPANGAASVVVIPVTSSATAGGGLFSAYFGPMGRWFRQGCWVLNSSTSPTLTLGSADTLFDAQFL